MQEDGKWIKPGALHVRRLFHIELFAGYGNTKRMYLQVINDVLVEGKK
jgi:hypothetical protein